MAMEKWTWLISVSWRFIGRGKYMNIFTKITFIFLSLFVAFVATPVFAAGISFDAQSHEFAQEEEFLMNVFLNTEGESINAAEGRVVFPADLLEAREIRDGNSTINFWVEKPRILEQGVIVFSGITPGGFSGKKELLFSIVFRAKKDGNGTIQGDAIRVLRNDGEGTEVYTQTSLFPFLISLESKLPAPEVEKVTDNEPPEDFKPIVTNELSYFDGKYALIFATQDKISGIDRYEVREGQWSRFSVAESPYLLKQQSLERKIFVKAIDKAGNERVAVLDARNISPWYQQYAILSILLMMIVVLFLLKILWPRFIQ